MHFCPCVSIFPSDLTLRRNILGMQRLCLPRLLYGRFQHYARIALYGDDLDAALPGGTWQVWSLVISVRPKNIVCLPPRKGNSMQTTSMQWIKIQSGQSAVVTFILRHSMLNSRFFSSYSTKKKSVVKSLPPPLRFRNCFINETDR